MSQKQPKDIHASINQRLITISRELNEDVNLVRLKYVIERLLYRISKSQYSKQFILKGAMLFAIWMKRPHRPTKDLDLLSFGDPSPERLTEIFRSICTVKVEPDGLIFDSENISVQEIREEEYQGKRVCLIAYLGRILVKIQIDMGFGDAITPTAEQINYPTLLDFPAPRILGYPQETVIAEKLHAMVVLGIANSRMKDFYDIWVIAANFSLDGKKLLEAVKATFNRRNTEIPIDVPLALSSEFAYNPDKSIQWKAFIKRNKLDEKDMELPTVIERLNTLLLPPLLSASKNQEFLKKWDKSGSWV